MCNIQMLCVKNMNEFMRMDQMLDDLKKEVNLYQELFGGKDSTDRLNRSFSEIFSVFQRALFFKIMVRISAVFDPANMRGDKNLTIEHLLSVSDKYIDKKTYLEFESIKYDFNQTGIKKIRNKLYAHHDLRIHLGKSKIASNISYEVLMQLLDQLKALVWHLGQASGQMPSSKIYRTVKLPKNRNGQALVEHLSRT